MRGVCKVRRSKVRQSHESKRKNKVGAFKVTFTAEDENSSVKSS